MLAGLLKAYEWIGAKAALWGGIILTATAALLTAYQRGKSAEKTNQMENTVDAYKERDKIDASVDRSSDANVDKRLQKWFR